MHEKEKEDCDSAMGKLVYFSDTIFPYKDIVDYAISHYYRGQAYTSMTDGGDPPVTECPFCGGAYLYEEEICAECGESATHECDLCGNTIPPGELSDGDLCGYCSNMMSKDD